MKTKSIKLSKPSPENAAFIRASTRENLTAKFSREKDEFYLFVDSILNADDKDLTQAEREFKAEF